MQTARKGDFVPWQQYPDVIYPDYVDPKPEISSIPDEPSPGTNQKVKLICFFGANLTYFRPKMSGS